MLSWARNLGPQSQEHREPFDFLVILSEEHGPDRIGGAWYCNGASWPSDGRAWVELESPCRVVFMRVPSWVRAQVALMLLFAALSAHRIET